LRKPAPFPSRSWEFYFQWSSQIRKKRPKKRLHDVPCLLSSWKFYWWMNSTPWSYSPHFPPEYFSNLNWRSHMLQNGDDDVLTFLFTNYIWWICRSFCPECVNLLIWSPAMDIVAVPGAIHPICPPEYFSNLNWRSHML
jgi:hypothetical protein